MLNAERKSLVKMRAKSVSGISGEQERLTPPSSKSTIPFSDVLIKQIENKPEETISLSLTFVLSSLSPSSDLSYMGNATWRSSVFQLDSSAALSRLVTFPSPVLRVSIYMCVCTEWSSCAAGNQQQQQQDASSLCSSRTAPEELRVFLAISCVYLYNVIIHINEARREYDEHRIKV